MNTPISADLFDGENPQAPGTFEICDRRNHVAELRGRYPLFIEGSARVGAPMSADIGNAIDRR